MSCSQDYDLWLRISQEHRIRVIGEPLYCSRRRAHSISAIGAEEQLRCDEAARDRARSSRVRRVLVDFDQCLITLEQAIEAVAALGREEEIGRLEQQDSGGAIARFVNKLRRSSGFGRRIWEPPRRRQLHVILSEHPFSSASHEQTLSRLRALIDPKP